MILCYPDTVRALPQYDEFVKELDRIKAMNISDYNKSKLVHYLEKRYLIKIPPVLCSAKCPYYQICKEQNKKMRAKTEQLITFKKYCGDFV